MNDAECFYIIEDISKVIASWRDEKIDDIKCFNKIAKLISKRNVDNPTVATWRIQTKSNKGKTTVASSPAENNYKEHHKIMPRIFKK